MLKTPKYRVCLLSLNNLNKKYSSFVPLSHRFAFFFFLLSGEKLNTNKDGTKSIKFGDKTMQKITLQPWKLK